MSLDLLQLGVPGLDLLTPGVRAVSRAPGLEPSASVLIRGDAGLGKTVLAAHIAIAVAKAWNANVLWCAIEQLPEEVEAQLASFVETRVPFRALGRDQPREAARPAIFAGMLPGLAQGSDDEFPLDFAVEKLADSSPSGFQPRVVVVDSLGRGYGLGSDIGRVDADALVKLAAQRGWFLVVVEESLGESSPWPFVVDMALLLTRDGRSRWIEVTKNRYARHASERAEYSIDDRPRAFPRPQLYLGVDQRVTREPSPTRWRLELLERVLGSPVGSIALFGQNPSDLLRLSLTLEVSGPTISIELGFGGVRSGERNLLAFGQPAAKVMAGVYGILSKLLDRPAAIFVGDLRWLSIVEDRSGYLELFRTLAVLGALGGFPVIFLESCVRWTPDLRPAQLGGLVESSMTPLVTGLASRWVEVTGGDASSLERPVRITLLADGTVVDGRIALPPPAYPPPVSAAPE